MRTQQLLKEETIQATRGVAVGEVEDNGCSESLHLGDLAEIM